MCWRPSDWTCFGSREAILSISRARTPPKIRTHQNACLDPMVALCAGLWTWCCDFAMIWSGIARPCNNVLVKYTYAHDPQTCAKHEDSALKKHYYHYYRHDEYYYYYYITTTAVTIMTIITTTIITIIITMTLAKRVKGPGSKKLGFQASRAYRRRLGKLSNY